MEVRSDRRRFGRGRISSIELPRSVWHLLEDQLSGGGMRRPVLGRVHGVAFGVGAVQLQVSMGLFK